MKKKNIILITGLMALALLGVMAMQYYFLRQSYNLQLSLFDSSVKEALNNVVTKVAKQDYNKFLIDKTKEQNIVSATVNNRQTFILKSSRITSGPHQKQVTDEVIVPLKSTDAARTRRINHLRDSLARLMDERKMENALALVNVQINIEQFTDEAGNVKQWYTPQLTKAVTDPRAYIRVHGKLRKYIDTTRSFYLDPQFGPTVLSIPNLNPLWVKEQANKKKELQVKQIQKLLAAETAVTRLKKTASETPGVFESLESEYRNADEPLKKRINQYLLDSSLRSELHNQGIDLPFSYDVAMSNNDSLIFSNASNLSGDKPVFLASNTYQVPIFNSEVINDPGKLKVSFPQKNSLILGHMEATMATTAGLLFVLIFCFGYTIYSILRQKKIAEMKTDFINNMTHEFKTPVSTIMIASEALKDAEIADDKTRVARLANIIYEENVRLGSHIERVLNIARIEKNDFKLDIKTLDVNEMITTVLDSMLLKLQKHDAKIDLQLGEDALMVKADELHFSNVIYNLIDNAIKYSNDPPEITISTQSKNGQAVIKVADKGIGMSHDQQSKIFEQFYRIPTGNLHDVKGFGLGLSYVNTIVKRLNGMISVKSERDKGSEFELRFAKI